MKERSLSEKYDYYRKYIEKIVGDPVSSPPSGKDLNFTRGVVQRGYAEIEAIQFPGSLVDYITWIGGLHTLQMMVGRCPLIDWPLSQKKIREELKKLVAEKPIDTAILIRATQLIRVIDLDRVIENISFGAEFDNEKNLFLLDIINYLFRIRRQLINLEEGHEHAKNITLFLETEGFKPIISNSLKNQLVVDGYQTSHTTSHSNKLTTKQPPPATTRAKGKKAASPASRAKKVAHHRP